VATSDVVDNFIITYVKFLQDSAYQKLFLKIGSFLTALKWNSKIKRAPQTASLHNNNNNNHIYIALLVVTPEAFWAALFSLFDAVVHRMD